MSFDQLQVKFDADKLGMFADNKADVEKADAPNVKAENIRASAHFSQASGFASTALSNDAVRKMDLQSVMAPQEAIEIQPQQQAGVTTHQTNHWQQGMYAGESLKSVGPSLGMAKKNDGLFSACCDTMSESVQGISDSLTRQSQLAMNMNPRMTLDPHMAMAMRPGLGSLL